MCNPQQRASLYHEVSYPAIDTPSLPYLTPYVVGVPASARRLFPDWIGIAPTLEDLPNRCIALVD